MIQSQISELDLRRIEQFCAARVPSHARDQVRLEMDVRGRNVTIIERRAPWRPDQGPDWSAQPVASLRWSAAQRRWTLYWMDSKSAWHQYRGAGAFPTVSEMLDELDRDPSGFFWG
jgi:hypothetical protein